MWAGKKVFSSAKNENDENVPQHIYSLAHSVTLFIQY